MLDLNQDLLKSLYGQLDEPQLDALVDLFSPDLLMYRYAVAPFYEMLK